VSDQKDFLTHILQIALAHTEVTERPPEECSMFVDDATEFGMRVSQFGVWERPWTYRHEWRQPRKIIVRRPEKRQSLALV
jgi:hypothetical protein